MNLQPIINPLYNPTPYKMETNKNTPKTENVFNYEKIRQDNLHETIHDFYEESGISGPVEAIGDLLKNFFSRNVDPNSLDEHDNPIVNYKAWNEDYVSELVHRSFQTINFIIKLKDDFDCIQGNKKNNTF